MYEYILMSILWGLLSNKSKPKNPRIIQARIKINISLNKYNTSGLRSFEMRMWFNLSNK